MATFADLLLLLRADSSDLDAKLDGAAKSIQDLSDSLDISKIVEGFGEVAAAAGIATSAFEIVKGALEDFSAAQNVQTSFSLLTGSAEEGEAAFESLKDTSIALAIPFENLVSVAQRLAPVFGVGTQGMADALKAAADAAAQTGNSFDAISSALGRIATSGTVSSKTLLELGISFDQIAEHMGTSVTDAEAKLVKGGQSAQADIADVIGTIEDNMGGAAEAIAQNLSGQFTILKNELGFISDDLGKALAPVASELIAGLEQIEPALIGIASGIQPAIVGFENMATAVHGMVPDFLQILATSSFWVNLGGTIGLIANALTTVEDAIHGTILILTDLVNGPVKGLSANVPQLTKDWSAFGNTLYDDVTLGFDKVITAASEANAKIADASKVSIGVLTPTPDGGDQASKAALTKAQQDLTAAARDYAAFLKATYTPALMSVGDAEQEVEDALIAYTSAQQAEQDTAAQIAIAQKNQTSDLTALEATFTQQKTASAQAAATYAQANRDLTASKADETTITKLLQAAEDAMASAEKSAYIPAILDHATALQNVSTAQNNQLDSIQAVADAEVDLFQLNEQVRNGELEGVDATNALNAAKAALATAEKTLTASTTALAQARKDETTSATQLSAVTKELDQDEIAAIATKKLLAPAITDISAAESNYEQALKDTQDASENLALAEIALALAQKDGDPQAIADATTNAKVAREALTVSTKDLNSATSDLTSTFKVNGDTLNVIKTNLDNWTQSQKVAEDAMSALGIQSVAVLQQIADKTTAAYLIVKNDPYASVTANLQANTAELQANINLVAEQGGDTTNLRILLDQTTSALQRQTQGWIDLYKGLNQVVTGDLSTAFDDILFNIDKVGADFKKLGEDIVDTVLNGIIKQALTPLIESMDKLIVEGVQWLGGLLGIGSGAASGAAGAAGSVAALTTNSTALGANTSALAALTSALGTSAGTSAAGDAGGVASSGASGAGGLASGAGALINTISGVVTAVASVATAIGTFIEGSAENEKLFEILNDTDRIDLAVEKSGTESIYQYTKLIVDNLQSYLPPMQGILNDISAAVQNSEAYTLTIANWGLSLPDLVTPLNAIVSAVTAGFQGLSTGLDTLNGSVAGLKTSGLSTVSAINPNVQPLQINSTVYLDAQELFQSFVTWMDQNGKVLPGF